MQSPLPSLMSHSATFSVMPQHASLHWHQQHDPGVIHHTAPLPHTTLPKPMLQCKPCSHRVPHTLALETRCAHSCVVGGEGAKRARGKGDTRTHTHTDAHHAANKNSTRARQTRSASPLRLHTHKHCISTYTHTRSGRGRRRRRGRDGGGATHLLRPPFWASPSSPCPAPPSPPAPS